MHFQFKVLDKTTKQLFSYEDIKTKILTEIFDDSSYHILPYIGFMDTNKHDIYAGDILQLNITNDLMQTAFANSNLGINCKNKRIQQIFLLIQPEQTALNIPYALYQKTNLTDSPETNGWLNHNDENHTIVTSFGTDCDFPRYLCINGAFITGNIFENPDILPRTASKIIYEILEGDYA